MVDGNVERVLRRLLGWRKQPLSPIWNAARQLLSRRSPGNFNQAMMELGALVCLPARPHCHVCPVSALCASRLPHPCPAPGSLPRSVARARDRACPELVEGVGIYSASKRRAARQTAEITYGLAARGDRVYLVRRGRRESLMPGMWELPQLSNLGGAGNGAPHRPHGAPHRPGFGGCGSLQPDFTLRHSITVTDHTVRVCRVPAAGLRGGRWFPLQDAAALPLTGLARKILRRASLV